MQFNFGKLLEKFVKTEKGTKNIDFVVTTSILGKDGVALYD